jgi:hypothetical protein
MISFGTGLSDHKWYHCAYKIFAPARVSTCQLYYLFIRRKHLPKECMFYIVGGKQTLMLECHDITVAVWLQKECETAEGNYLK